MQEEKEIKTDEVVGIWMEIEDKFQPMWDCLPKARDYDVLREEDGEEFKFTITDLKWLAGKLKAMEKVLDAIKSDERWKRFEVGRVYLTRWDCLSEPERVRQVA